MCNLLGVFGPFQIYLGEKVSHICFDQLSYLFIWCQIGAGVKLTPLHSWCQIGTGVKLTLLHSWCQIVLPTLLVSN